MSQEIPFWSYVTSIILVLQDAQVELNGFLRKYSGHVIKCDLSSDENLHIIAF